MAAGQSQHYSIATVELLAWPDDWRQLSGHQSGSDAVLKILQPALCMLSGSLLQFAKVLDIIASWVQPKARKSYEWGLQRLNQWLSVMM